MCSQCGLYKETAQFSPWLQPRAFDIPSTVERLTSELPLALSLEGNYKRPRWRDWQSEGLLYRKPSHMTVWEGLLARLQQSLSDSWGKKSVAPSSLCMRQDELKHQILLSTNKRWDDWPSQDIRTPVRCWDLYLDPAWSPGAFSVLTVNRLVFAIIIVWSMADYLG